MIVVQGLGALSLVAYPGVLVASVMALAAPGHGLAQVVGRGIALLGISYPLAWGLLYWLSWRAFRRGRPGLALTFALPPLVFSLAGVAVLAVSALWSASILRGFARGNLQEAERIRAGNAPAGAVLLYSQGAMSRAELERVIRAADQVTLSRPVERREVEVPGVRVTTFPGSGPDPGRRHSPLAIALRESGLDRRLEMRGAEPMLEAARLLMQRGARLSAEEQAREGTLVWLVDLLSRDGRLPDPGAEQENPLVWKIMTTPPGSQGAVAEAIFSARARQPELLRVATRTYGTPLRAALLRGMGLRVRDLVNNGAVLSASERAIPSLVHQLDLCFDLPVNAGLRERYETNLRNPVPGR
ncbi:MAG: hypothetical protein HY823_01985 [Acidobacteria bacterium]|nr:hypothetical protein [Acidobacteriota bacterium]